MRFWIDQPFQGIFFFVCFVCISASLTSHKNWNLLDRKTCGENLQLTERIIGGKKASLGQYPWIARLAFSFVGKTDFLIYNCAGSLINERYVVSAAHCLEERRIYVSMVRLGENYMATERDCFEGLCAPPVQDIRPEAVIPHQRYGKPHRFANDILLIRLEKPAVFNDFVVPICLPFGKILKKDYLSQALEVAGWGTTNSTTGTHSDDLLYIKIAVQPLGVCKDHFRANVKIGKGQICAGGEKNVDSCTGDSGGPFMKVDAVDGRPRYFLIGVVSFGPSFCGSGPAIYTSITHHLPWILDHMKPY